MKRNRIASIPLICGGVIILIAAVLGIRFAMTTPLFREYLFNNFHINDFSRVTVGMTKAEVKQTLNCAPHAVDTTNENKGIVVWEYYDGISPDSYRIIFTDGTVSATEVDN